MLRVRGIYQIPPARPILIDGVSISRFKRFLQCWQTFGGVACDWLPHHQYMCAGRCWVTLSGGDTDRSDSCQPRLHHCPILCSCECIGAGHHVVARFSLTSVRWSQYVTDSTLSQPPVCLQVARPIVDVACAAGMIHKRVARVAPHFEGNIVLVYTVAL